MIIIVIASIFPSIVYAEILDESTEYVTVNTQIYINGNVKNIYAKLDKEKLEELQKHLIKLHDFIDRRDKEDILSEIMFLKNEGLLEGNPIEIYNLISQRDYQYFPNEIPVEGNISNYLCYVNAVGDGLMLFTIGHILYLLAKNGFVLPGVIYVLILMLTHIIPFRILLPIGAIDINSGSISILGLNGYMHLTTTDKTIVLSLIGFTGLVINFPVNTDLVFLFVSGFSLIVTDENIFGYTP